MSEAARSERFLRYSGIVNPQDLLSAHILIVGVGAIGRQVALQLAAMGVGAIEVCDPDEVEEANMGAQGYRPDQLGEPKVKAIIEDMKAINPDGDYFAHATLYHRKDLDLDVMDPTAIFCCVDCMDARREIWTDARNSEIPFFDTRMSGLAMQTYACVNNTSLAAYGNTLFSNEEAHPEPCTARSVLFTSNIVAGLAVSQWAQSLRGGLPYPFLSMSLADYTIEPLPLGQIPPVNEALSDLQGQGHQPSVGTAVEEPPVVIESDPGSS